MQKMKIDDYDTSFSSICNRNETPQQAKKELLHWLKKLRKAEEEVEKLEKKLNEAERNVRFFRKGLCNTFFLIRLQRFTIFLSNIFRV